MLFNCIVTVSFDAYLYCGYFRLLCIVLVSVCVGIFCNIYVPVFIYKHNQQDTTLRNNTYYYKCCVNSFELLMMGGGTA